MICSLILSLVNGTIWCNNSYSCALTSVQESTSGTVNCYGFYSCYKSPKIVNAVGYAFCDGSYSCYKADEVFAANVNWGQCSGLYSCREIGNYTVKYAHVCESEQSCSDSRLYSQISNNFWGRGARCLINSRVSGESNYYMYGESSGKNSIIGEGVSYNNIRFYGKDSGKNVTVKCDSGSTCNINCREDACSSLILNCSDNCNVDCTYAHYSDVCSDGYNIPSYLSDYIPLPSILDSSGDNTFDNITLTTDDNGYNPCYTPTTGATHCDSYKECIDSTTELQDIDAPICCTASYSCKDSINITTDGIDFNGITAIEDVAIRCDGSYSCNSITDYIAAKNGGHIFFSGWYSGYSNNIIETTISYDIICSGSYSCGSTTNIRNCRNLYCGGYKSCNSIGLINNVKNVWMYGYISGTSSTMNNIINSVYCGSEQSCHSNSISNVGNMIIENAYQALVGCTIDSVDNGVFAMGYQVMYSCVISDVSNNGIKVSGYQSLFQSTITNVENVCKV